MARPGFALPAQGIFVTGLIVNLILVVLYLWALDDTIAVNIQVNGNSATATVNDSRVSFTNSSYPQGKVALYMNDYRSARAYTTPDYNSRGLRGALNRWEGFFVNTLAPSQWKEIKVTSARDNRVLLDENFDDAKLSNWELVRGNWHKTLWGGIRSSSSSGIAYAGDASWEDYLLRARLERGKEEIGILVRSNGQGSGYLFWFRPEHEDMGWQRWRNGVVEESLDVSHFPMTFGQSLKSTLRDFLSSYWAALGLLVGLAAIATVAGKALSRITQETLSIPLPFPNPNLFAGGIVIFSLMGTAFIAWDRLGGIPHVQDSVAYLFQAKIFALGRFSAPSPPIPDFFTQEFIINRGGQWFGKYPPGHPLILSLGVLSGAPWLVGPVVSALSLGFIFLIAQEIYTPKTGLLAIGLALVSPFFLFLSSSFMSHSTALFFLSLFIFCWIKLCKGRGVFWAILAGFALGFAFITRQLTALAIGAPFLVAGLIPGFVIEREFRLKKILLNHVVMGATASLPVLFMLWFNWQVAGSPLANPFQLWWDFDRLGFGTDIGGRGGHTPSEGLVNTRANLNTLMVHLFGWTTPFTLAFLFIPFVSARSSRWDWLLLIAFLSPVVAQVFYWADGIMYGPRYYYEALPSLLLLTARGMTVLMELITKLGAWLISKPLSRSIGGLGVGVVVVLLIAINIVHYVPGQWELYKDYNNLSPKTAQLVESLGISNAVVFVDSEPVWQWWKYSSVFPSNDPLLKGEIIYARDLGERDRELKSAFPGRKFFRLREVGGYFNLEELP